MVPSQQRYPILVLHLQTQNVTKRLDTIEPTVNIVSHKQVIGVLDKFLSTGISPPISKSYMRS